MARTVTVAQIGTRARERADMVNSGFITASELIAYISSSYAELYEMLIQSGLIFFTPGIQTITATGSETYALPADYYGTMRVDRLESGTYYSQLVEYMEPERSRFENASSGGQAEAYSVQGTNIHLLPVPSSGTYRHRYIPNPAVLTLDADTVDGVGGWEEWIVVDVARKMLAKEESSTTSLERDLERLKARIEEMAMARAWASPRRVVDTRRNDEWQGDDWWHWVRPL